jgi:hypothetical protein
MGDGVFCLYCRWKSFDFDNMMMVVVMGVGADLGEFLCSRFRGMDI